MGSRAKEKAHPEIHILLVDSNKRFLRLTSAFLTRSLKKAVISKASSMDEALAKAQERHPQVILLDLLMPEMPGIEFVSQLREMFPEVSIIVLTMLDEDVYRRAALAAGADEFVAKANLTTELLPTIYRVCNASGL